MVIADGMADRPVKELGWKTPLEAARRPSLNEIAKTGICGIVDPISPGVPPGSDAATLALLGYDALRVYTGRGALEALGSGVSVLPGDVAFRCNFATVDGNMVVHDRRAGRISSEDATKLAESLQRVIPKKSFKARYLFRNTIQHRNVLLLRGPKLSTSVSDTDPGKISAKMAESRPLEDSSEAELTAEILNALSREFHRILENHPVNRNRVRRSLPQANAVLCRGAGVVPNIRPLPRIYGIKAACIGATPLVKGVCKAAGIETVEVKGATGTPKTDYNAKAKATVQTLKSYDFALLHVKAADVASHDGNAKLKVDIIEKIDSLLGCILDDADRDTTYIAVTADHTTSLATGRHEGDPVPLAVTGPQIRRDNVDEYGERTCAHGGLNRIRGADLMPILMNLLGKTRIFGA